MLTWNHDIVDSSYIEKGRKLVYVKMQKVFSSKASTVEVKIGLRRTIEIIQCVSSIKAS